MNTNVYRLVFDRRRGMCVAVAESVAAAGKPAAGARRARRARRAAAALALTGLASAAAQTLPSGAQVVRGAGTIKVDGAAMVVQQGSQRLVTDWQSFSIGAGASVQFVQPSANAVALNRVVGGDASRIFGSLTANGHVYLQNPSGVLFAPGAQVDVGSLVATTLRADIDQFIGGRLVLSEGAVPSAAVVNDGELRAAPGGHVVLAGPQVRNAGTIEAPGGTVALAAGRAVTMDATGAGLLDIRVPAAALNAELVHSGRIVADGGQVSLQVAAADAARRVVMQVDGLVRARRIENRGGQIVLAGGDSGIVQAGATLDASSPDGQGGRVHVLGDRVALVGAARADASGANGGGQVLVGGNFQGKGPEANAQATFVGRGVTLDASAGTAGDGGRVVVWADGHTAYAGQAYATGGAQGGDGGLVEVSGKQTLDFRGGADLRAARGRTGTLLLDPQDIVIGTVADLNGDSTAGDDLGPGDLPLLDTDFPGAFSQITADAVAALLFTTNVDLQASNSISVTAPLTVAAGGDGSVLTLDAPTISISAPMVLNNSSLNIVTSFPFSDSVTLAADITTNAAVAIDATSISLDSGTVTAASVTFTSTSDGSGNVSQSIGHSIVADSVTAGVAGQSFGFVGLSGANLIQAFDFDAGTVFLGNGDIGGRLSIGGNAGSADFTLVGGLEQSAPLTVDSLTLTATDPDPVSGAVLLTDAGNAIDTLGFNTASHVEVVTSGALGVSDFLAPDESTFPVQAGGDIRLVAAGVFTLNSDIGSSGALGPPTIDISGAGFSNSGSFALLPAGGRFLIRSTDFTADSLGMAFGEGAPEINFVVFAGYTGAEPTSGNGFFTNETGSLLISDLTELGDFSRTYDGTTAIAVTRNVTTTTASAFLDGAGSGDVPVLPVIAYTASFEGDYDDRHAATDKGFTLAPTFDTEVIGDNGSGAAVSYYGLQIGTITRPAGASVSIPVSEVLPLALAVSGVAASSKVYDTTTTAALTGTASAPVLGVDTVVLGGTPVATFADKNVGIGKPVSVTGYVLTGTDAGNYTLSQPTGLSADITPALLAVTGLTALDKVYDTTSDATLAGTATITPLGSDTLTLGGSASAGFADKNAGTAKPVTVTGLTLGGTDAGNYTLQQPSGLSADITPALLAVTGLTALDKVYDATSAATLGGEATVAALGSDVLTLDTSEVSANFSDKNVGSAKTVAVTGLTLGGTDAANYALQPPTGLTASITPATLFVGGLVVEDKVYDATTLATLGGTASIAPLGEDSVTLAGSAVGNFSDKNVGSGKSVSVSGLALAGPDAGNYVLAVAPSLLAADITPLGVAPSGIVAIDRPADGSLTVDLDTSSAGIAGVLPGDDVSLLTGGASGVVDSAAAGAEKPVTLLGLELAGADAGNYLLLSGPGIGGTTVTFSVSGLAELEALFEEVRFKEYLQGVSDAQEPFRRAMAEALAAGFGKENIRKRLSLGLVFETGLAGPAIEDIQPASGPSTCTATAASASPLGCP